MIRNSDVGTYIRMYPCVYLCMFVYTYMYIMCTMNTIVSLSWSVAWKLEYMFENRLLDAIISLGATRLAKSKRDALLLGFREAKVFCCVCVWM